MPHPRMHVMVFSVILLTVLVVDTSADVRLSGLFSDNMVLQQGMKIPVWGRANPGEKITVSLGGQMQTTTADDNGKWRITLDPLEYGGPFEMTVTGNNQIVVSNVLVGEVWVCSGQSNMQWPVQSSANAQQEIAQANYPNIRFLTVPRKPSLLPQEDVTPNWVECSPETVPGFTAVGYFFGRDLHKELNVPIGLINSSWGGTVAEAWTSLEKLSQYPETKPIVDRFNAELAKYPDLKERFAEYHSEFNKTMSEWYRQRAEWQKAVEQAKAEGKQPPAAPPYPQLPGSQNTASALYNGMIVPLCPFAIRGAIWYQGEGNAGRAYQYRTLLPAMIECWREAWNQGDFPFLVVQLANYMAVQTDPNEASAWAELREAQAMVLSKPNTGLAVTIDIGEADDIHPKNKQDVGWRLAAWALANTYGRDIVYSGPLYDSMSVEDGKIRLHFKHVGSGLIAKDEEGLKGFVIAGEDRKFVWANATIDGDTVVVSSPEVAAPVAVRYAWANNPVCNLYNKEGFPASPFRTDTWPGVTDNNR